MYWYLVEADDLVTMAIEIERRFLVAAPDWREHAVSSSFIKQAYLSVTSASAIRVRIKDDETAFITIKSAKSEIEREEFEYSIPVDDANQLIALSIGKLIQKQRFIVPADHARWEIDVFAGNLAGLIIAEIELSDKNINFSLPSWLGEEITSNPLYSNASLATHGRPHARPAGS